MQRHQQARAQKVVQLFSGKLRHNAGQQIICTVAVLIVHARPKDLSEAAAIDGAGTWQRFKSITVPMLMPSFTIVFFLTLSKCFMLLDQNVALTDGNFSTRMLAMQILYTTRDGSPPDYGLAQAQAVIFFVLIAAVTLVQVSITSKKEVEL